MKLWGGRFTKETNQLVHNFNESLSFDQKFYRQDIRGSIAHVTMLAKQGILSENDKVDIIRGLESILKDLDSGELTISPDSGYEDIHSFVEGTLTERVGEAGKRLHTGRSRNDQVALDMKLYTRDEIQELDGLLKGLLNELLTVMEANLDTFMPGFTHLQKAQPITLAHHIGAYFEMFSRDRSRLHDIRRRMNYCPLGSGALAGTTYPLDRAYTAQLLGFDGIITNTLDAVATRDYLLELAADFSTMGSTLSRFAQDLYLWSTAEFNYVSFSDAYSCCSSIMPQKKNPLSIEHIKSKSSHLTSTYLDIAMCLKGTSYGHCRDVFECMPPFWDAVEQVTGMLELSIGTLQDITFHYDRMEFTASMNDSILTDMADFLVQKDRIPFRSAHNIIASAVRAQGDNPSSKITLKQLNKSSKQHLGHDTTLTESEWASLQSPRSSVANKRSEGSPAQSSCRKMLLSLRMAADRCNEQYNKIINSLQLAEQFRKEQIDVLKNGTHFEHN